MKMEAPGQFQVPGRKKDETPSTREVLGEAAIVYKGEVFTGMSHGHATEALRQKYPEFSYDDIENSDGFVTSTGRFVSRAEALSIARRAKQIKPGSDNSQRSNLYSEDLRA